MSSVLLTLTKSNGETVSLTRCVSLQYEKERYVPYSTMQGVFQFEGSDCKEISDVRLTVNGREIHRGAADYFAVKRENGRLLAEVSSRGYTSMMGQTEMTPGVIQTPSLNSFMSGWEIPFMTHENQSETVNYLYVKEHTSLWDAVVNLCLKQKDRYPYVAFSNDVRFSPPVVPKTVVLQEGDEAVVSFGNTMDGSRMISDLHMKDTQGTYNTFNFTDSEARALNIVRHKHFPMDRQWLDDPMRSLVYRANFAMRGWKSLFVKYQGYQGEDLLDRIVWNEGESAEISRIQITGNAKGIFTKLWCYQDRYCNAV